MVLGSEPLNILGDDSAVALKLISIVPTVSLMMMKLLLVLAFVGIVGIIGVGMRTSSDASETAMSEDAPNENGGAQLMLVRGKKTPSSTTTQDLSAADREWIEKSYGADAHNILEPMKKSAKLYVPAVGMMESMMSVTPDTAHITKASDFEIGVHIVQMTLPGGNVVEQAAAYIDPKLLNSNEVIEEVEARNWLEEMLRFQPSEGIVINPKTRFMQDDYRGIYLSTNRYGVAELIGYLEAPVGVNDRYYYELANEAYAAGNYYQVLYFWARSYRSGDSKDDWTKAEEAKLRAYWALSFPGSRERSRSELQWMMDNHPSAEMAALAREFTG